MEFFDGFSWAVPTVFTEAVSNCKFEEGDILYNLQSAYQKWETALKESLCYIKVKDPKRTSEVSIDKNRSVFLNNWDSNIKIELHTFYDQSDNGWADKGWADKGWGDIKLIETTQGRVFYMLWKNDPDFLDMKKESPTPPWLLSDVKKRINETIPACDNIAESNPYFIMIHDPSNATSRNKHIKILDVLQKEYDCTFYKLSAKESGFKNHENIFPVIQTNLYIIKNSIIHKRIEQSLKQVLYISSPEIHTTNFSLKNHGLLIVPKKKSDENQMLLDL